CRTALEVRIRKINGAVAGFGQVVGRIERIVLVFPGNLFTRPSLQVEARDRFISMYATDQETIAVDSQTIGPTVLNHGFHGAVRIQALHTRREAFLESEI